ncbi:MAG TPA: response regulator [Luteolibacter sp.]|nr:response regulator [Luteolibacter sp.]
MIDPPLIHIIDDEPSFRQSLARLLRANGLNARLFDSASQFLSCADVGSRGCVILDVHMPGECGLELQDALVARDSMLPVIFLTGRGDIPMTVRAMKAGAADFLTKPVDEKDLLAAVAKALERNRAAIEQRSRLLDARGRLATLSEREHEVMTHVIAGGLNKQIADRLGISEKTVKVHRGRVMQKMGVASVAELVRACGSVGVAPADHAT